MGYITKVFGDRVEYYFNDKLNDTIINGKVVPAVKYANGTKHYYKDGERHRDDDPKRGPMPAVEYANGGKEYYKNGKLHRDNDPKLGPMPAIEWISGNRAYYKDGIQFTPPNQDE